MKFELGQVVMTRGVADFAAENTRFSAFVTRCMIHHAAGDWGDLTEEDIEMNNDALKNGGRLFSAYNFREPFATESEYGERRNKIWIITEYDRSATTVLFPDEY